MKHPTNFITIAGWSLYNNDDDEQKDNNKEKEIPSIQYISFVYNAGSLILIGVIIEVIPKTAKILNTLDPIKFPIEIAFSFFMTAIIEAASSALERYPSMSKNQPTPA